MPNVQTTKLFIPQPLLKETSQQRADRLLRIWQSTRSWTQKARELALAAADGEI